MMRDVDRCPLRARWSLLGELAREPTMVEVSQRCGLTPVVVRRAYLKAKLDTRRGQREKRERSHAAIAEMLAGGASAKEVAEARGVSLTLVCMVRRGMPRAGAQTWSPGWAQREGLQHCDRGFLPFPARCVP